MPTTRRLTLTIARTAVAHGAVAMNYAEVVSFERHDGRVVGARDPRRRRRDDDSSARVVNATGVWADDVRALDEGSHPATIRPAKGVHITLPWERVGNTAAAIVPSAHDNRSVFVIPWAEHTYVGTTDTDYDGPRDDPQCTEEEAAYLLDALNGVTTVKATSADVVGSWAGLRPLLATAADARSADLSRRHGVHVAPSGVVTVTGGKLTTYRRMAADAVDAAARVLGASVSRSATKHLRLLGSDGVDRDAAEGDHLVGRYGAEATAIRGTRRCRPHPRRAARARSGVRPRRSGVRSALRDGAHARRRVVAADSRARPRCSRRRSTRPRPSPISSHPSSAGPTTSASAKCATTARLLPRIEHDHTAAARRLRRGPHRGRRRHDVDGGTRLDTREEAGADDHRPSADHYNLAAAPRVRRCHRMGGLRQRLRVRDAHRARRLASTIDRHRPPRARSATRLRTRTRGSARSS